jgi:hypothetical protein
MVQIPEEIKRELERRKGKVSNFPEWWTPEPGSKLIGVVTRIRSNPWEDNRFLYEVEDESENKYTLPAHEILMNALANLNVHEGDAILIEYKGEVRTKKGRLAKDYEVSYVRADELQAKVTASTKLDIAPAKTDIDPILAEQIKGFAQRLLDLFGEISVDEFAKNIKRVTTEVSLDKVLEISELEEVDGMVRKRGKT